MDDSPVTIEIAKSNRTHCRNCKIHVPKDNYRIAVHIPNQFGVKKMLYCIPCGKDIIQNQIETLQQVLEETSEIIAPHTGIIHESSGSSELKG